MSAVLAAAGGCHAPGDWKLADLFDLNKGFPWSDEGPKPRVPVRVVGTWTDAVLHKEGQAAQRGFGGRLFFYGRESADPVPVNGQLVVYAFDETGRDPTDNRPTRRYVFPSEQIPLHMSESELGTSYSFWLPWDEVGGPQTEVSLICRFEPKGGAVVTSEQTRHLLPGALVPGTMQAGGGPPKLPYGLPSRPAVRQAPYSADGSTCGVAQTASYESRPDGGGEAEPDRRMTTTSITLPEGFSLGRGVTSVRGGPGRSPADRAQSATLEQSSGGSPWARPQPPTALPAARPQPATVWTGAMLPRPPLPFTNPPPQMQTVVPTAQQVPVDGWGAASQGVTNDQTLAPVGGLTTTVSYRFPGQTAEAAAPQAWSASSGSSLPTLPAQAGPGSPAPAAAIR